MLQYTLVETRWGLFGLLRDELGLRAVFFPSESPADIPQRFSGVVRGDGAFGDLPERLRGYLAGATEPFPDAISPHLGSRFQQRVWALTRTIPWGQTRTYGELARELSGPHAARAVGQALAANPCPVVIPCHRVIGADGRLRGFRRGLVWKALLLQREGNQTGQFTTGHFRKFHHE